MKRQFVIPLTVFLLLILGTAGVVLYGRGYRFSFESGKTGISGTGLLVTTSIPNGAQVFINGHLTTATDNTINLAPGTYKIQIAKQGYLSWEKTIKIDKEVVAKADALLFPTAPTLESITDNGILNPTIDPSGSKIAFTVASESARQNGVYVLDMTARSILALQSSSKQLSDDTLDIFSKANLSWSPDGTSLLATISAHTGQPTTYLIDSSQFNQNPKDVTETLSTVKADWTQQKQKKDKALTSGLKLNLNQLITENFSNPSWSPDGTKILYTASRSATLPIIITPRLIGIDSTPEQRSTNKDSLYIYDVKEDKNYQITLPNQDQILHSISWLADSKHIIYVSNSQIHAVESDGTNDTIVYAGPFIDSYVFPWPDASKIVILTNLNNPQIPPNLYTISLK